MHSSCCRLSADYFSIHGSVAGALGAACAPSIGESGGESGGESDMAEGWLSAKGVCALVRVDEVV